MGRRASVKCLVCRRPRLLRTPFSMPLVCASTHCRCRRNGCSALYAKGRDGAGVPVKVTVVTLAWLEEMVGNRERVVDLPDGAKVEDAIRSLGVDEIEYATVVLNS